MRAGAANFGRLIGALHFEYPSRGVAPACLWTARRAARSRVAVKSVSDASAAKPCSLGALRPTGDAVQVACAPVWRWGNPRLEQKPPWRSNTCTTACGGTGGLTQHIKLWITRCQGHSWPYNPAALRTTCPQ
jgi:hypothetical protein